MNSNFSNLVTRKEFMFSKTMSHRGYWKQFVNQQLRAAVSEHIGLKTLLSSDPDNIPDKQLAGVELPAEMVDRIKWANKSECSERDIICAAREAARQIKEINHVR